MSLIFDSFPTMERAHAFQAEVKKRFNLDGQVFADAAEAFDHDPFPYEMKPPVVHIDRPGLRTTAIPFTIEQHIERLVEDYGGIFLGT
jgi:hypothetical protein